MKLTIELDEVEIVALQQEAADLGTFTKIETLAVWYMRFGWHTWLSNRQQAEQQAEQAIERHE